MRWKYFKSKFEYEKDFMDTGWSWSGHRCFAYDLVCNTHPKTIVELGTHKGTSFFSFCQAVKDKKTKTKIFAVDTWKGDKHAGMYDESIYEDVKKIIKKYYFGVRPKLLRTTFNKAVSEFKDGSIDILHIDGLHTYEAVKHDLETWIDKVSIDGIVLFHDISVVKSDFGVLKLWKELKKKYLNVGFDHSYGLGVLYKGNKYYISDIEEEWRAHYSFLNDEMKVKKIFVFEKELKKREEMLEKAKNELIQKNKEISRNRMLLKRTTRTGSKDSEKSGNLRSKAKAVGGEK